ncbi:cellulase family glycosylhydrolase [Aquimarina sp. MMG015]|uniref:glycoside hydrolase family 2 TIM barrel-domain containing protein n=2 Tax=Aquimarina TaxID=290174 RepID=UPI0004026C08|nr:glycoside hydrolase family 2 TIM barrel-domain containing protein [Aquimarina sp. MMG015]MBQ4802779.1 cellulase family glycosylhydrolase [Aquimarina sp. MMG015]
MKKQNKMIYRSFIIISFIIINGLILFGISQTLSFLNTGADRSMMLHIGVKNKQAYIPKVAWKDSINPARSIEKQTMMDIQKDYINSWYVRNVGYKTYDSLGIFDFYTESARENLIKSIEFNLEKNIKVVSTTINHNLALDFYSADGQLVVFEDQNVTSYTQYFKENELQFEATDTSDYKIAMLLEDGFWRVRHIVKQPLSKPDTIQQKKSTYVKGKKIIVDSSTYQIKGINYYPQKTPWNMFGDNFKISTIKKDFEIIKNAGLNTIRIFVPYKEFGKEYVKAEKLQKLKQVLDLAEDTNLKVVLTLFDFYGNYAIDDWTFTHRHAEQIINAVKDHNALLVWDIKNEPNLDFESRRKETVLAWLKEMIRQVRSLDSTHPITIGWSSIESANLLSDELDIISFHYYLELENFSQSFSTISSIDKPLVLQEFGLSSNRGLWAPFGNSKKDQASYHEKMQEIIQQNELHYMSWTLYDFDNIPTEVVGRLPWRKNAQKHFGFIDAEGNKKDAFQFISY